MRLSEIAAMVEVPVCNITSEAIKNAKARGLITEEQEENLLLELEKADGIWKNPVPAAGCADSLW